HSLAMHCPRPLRFVIVDDGTLSAKRINDLRSLLTGCKIVCAAEIEARLDANLPASRFPVLRKRRLHYPHLRKLTDIHVGSHGWKLVLDSDMLFHKRPDFLLRWLANPTAPIHMTDVENAYGYTHDLMESLTGHLIPDRVNVGVCGLNSSALDWPRLERWCEELMLREGSHYLQEQALVAMLMSGVPHVAISSNEAIVAPSLEECRTPSVSLHHYVADSKAWYFRSAWRDAAHKAGG
ncbi:MAG: hypothetical protein K2Y29_03395, partial [Beijerinckiaceae bacterium]|nr:hypothetical protein [Beijerinckiaceae bacterium]